MIKYWRLCKKKWIRKWKNNQQTNNVHHMYKLCILVIECEGAIIKTLKKVVISGSIGGSEQRSCPDRIKIY